MQYFWILHGCVFVRPVGWKNPRCLKNTREERLSEKLSALNLWISAGESIWNYIRHSVRSRNNKPRQPHRITVKKNWPAAFHPSNVVTDQIKEQREEEETRAPTNIRAASIHFKECSCLSLFSTFWTWSTTGDNDGAGYLSYQWKSHGAASTPLAHAFR